MLDFKKDVGLWHGILTVSVTPLAQLRPAYIGGACVRVRIRICVLSGSGEPLPATL